MGHLGVGRRYTDTTSLLTPRRLALPVPPLPDFNQLHAEAQQLQRQVALAESAQVVTSRPAPASAQTPRTAGYPIPFLSPAEQAQRQQQARRERAQLVERLLADYNRLKAQPYISEALRRPLMNGLHNLLTQLGTGPVAPAGSDSFMPASFWHTQYQETPKGWKSTFKKGKNGKPGHWTTFNHWTDCCNTCKRMIKKQLGVTPVSRIQVVLEHGRTLVPQQGAAAGFDKVDNYMALHKPVMVGVTFAYGLGYNEDKTSDHFVVLVGTGVKNGKKYYRFFDVGTQHEDKGTNPNFKLFYDEKSKSYKGSGLLGEYTISQIRF